jgi:hypothetical protein
MQKLFIFFLLLNFQPVKLKKVDLTEKVSVSLPLDFQVMTDEDIVRKYFSSRKPVAAFTQPDRTADFSFNENATPWQKQDLNLLRDFYRSGIRRLYTKVEFFQENIRTIGKREFAVFEFVAEVREDDKISPEFGKTTRTYEYIQYTIENRKVLIFHFSCPARLQPQWRSVAKEIMQTIKVKP